MKLQFNDCAKPPLFFGVVVVTTQSVRVKSEQVNLLEIQILSALGSQITQQQQQHHLGDGIIVKSEEQHDAGGEEDD